MARLGKLLISARISASTLVEAIIAMLIVTIAFSLALVLILNISKNSNNSLKTKAYFLANDIIVQTKVEKEFLDEEFNFGNVTVRRTVTEYEGNEELFQLNIAAYDAQNRKLFEQNELIIIEK